MTKPLGIQLPQFTYRTINLSPPVYERELADALFAILGRSIHEPEAIAAVLNEAGFKPGGGGEWSAASFREEMRRLGSWTNSVGALVGTHSQPGLSLREGNCD